MNLDGFQFDVVTQRFLKNRWETDEGKVVLQQILEGLKAGGDVRGTLDEFVLDHAENKDPYGHPIYPKDAMVDDRFWVLTQDDLRGIQIYNEEFPEKTSFAKKALNYSRFHNCKLKGVNFEQSSLTETTFDKCNLRDTCFAISGGHFTNFIHCDFTNSCFTKTVLEDADFSGSIMKGVYFESAKLNNIKVNYLTKFDENLNRSWSNNVMPEEQVPEILKSIRIAYENAEIWSLADQFLFLELSQNRKSILWKSLKIEINPTSLRRWGVDWMWCIFTGYGVKPHRVLLVALLIANLFAIGYYVAGNPGSNSDFVTSLYYSFTTFATLGYGDLYYLEPRWIMRLISTFEALLGATLIAVFVSVMARKLLRR